MTTVYPISGATSAEPGRERPTPTPSGNNSLNENTFLTLLVAQLKYQDPMNPADSTQFLSQTAQFTQVQTLQKMAKQQAAQQAASQLLAASTMIGRPVSATRCRQTARPGTPTPTSVVSVRGSLPKRRRGRNHARPRRPTCSRTGHEDPARARLHQDRERVERAGGEQRREARPARRGRVQRLRRPDDQRRHHPRVRARRDRRYRRRLAAVRHHARFRFGERSDPPATREWSRDRSPSPNRTATTARPRPASSPAST